MKLKNYVPLLVVGGIAVGAIYFISRMQPVAPVTPSAGVPQPPILSPTFRGTPSVGAVAGVTDIMAMAEQQLGLPRSELVMRGLRPEDLNLTTSWNFTSTAANTWENWFSTSVADNTFIVIQGVSYGGTNFAQLRVSAAASTSAYFNLSFIAGLQSQLYYATVPVTAQQNQLIMGEVISKAVATESTNLMGTVIEKRGITINP